MFKKNQQTDENNGTESVNDKINQNNSVKLNENSLLNVVVGSLNVKRWNTLKVAFSCKNNESFVTKLLDLAQEFLNRNEVKENDHKKTRTSKKKKSPKRKEEVESVPQESKEKITLDKFETTNTKTEESNVDRVSHASIPVLQSLDKTESKDIDEKTKKKKPSLTPEKVKKEKIEPKKTKNHDVRKAPELIIQNISKSEKESTSGKINASFLPAKTEKQCHNCNTRHIDHHCPLNHPYSIISDGLTPDEWHDKHSYQSSDFEGKENDFEEKHSFSKLSLPSCLYFEDSGVEHGCGVFVKSDIKSFTQFGPLIGQIVKEVDIPEDSTMRDLWEISQGSGNIYINTENVTAANWIRFIRPAPTRDEKNLTVVVREDQLYFVSVRLICKGEELLYWQDGSVSASKKKLEKTSCGGCNMNFTHPIYYRIHCSVFHDVRYSLTIRKYHCKICGEAVLGKENIMKHAAKLHNGQGAYQCQFCKKFFLRLNYLEMHRTYGCSANPHRSRPLCDFCGRKFCQPQKLKVHIKRMHSDFSEVLKEFQCKSCMKILGSRAALQRHLKEVHQKQIDGACSCTRCGKHFQNKSNLKIHMLTHSGIKPFRCATDSCNAAFTTKQCLQFHYKKVHNFTEESMPKIERSVDYTFQAYSGCEEMENKHENSMDQSKESLNMEDESDIDDESLDSKSMDDPPALQSPLQVTDEQSQPSASISPLPAPESYINSSNNMKVLTKGSKKWIGDDHIKSSDIYQIDHRLGTSKDDLNISLQPSVHESEMYERKLNGINDFGRHHHQEASNASLLVEAALDSVCSEPNIDIDVSSTQNCTDSLVSNLYTLAQQQPNDNLQNTETYNETVCITDQQRDMNLMSPSVNDHISVTDELNDELRHHNHNINIDYANFHQETDFSPANSPGIMQQRSNFVRNYINSLSPPPQSQSYGHPANKSLSPVPSPPRYDFGHGNNVSNNEHLSSDDSNGMAAQNLSVNNSKNDIQLDLSIYKSPYKDFRIKNEQKQILTINSLTKNYINCETNSSSLETEVDNINQHDLSSNIQNIDDVKQIEASERIKYTSEMNENDTRGKFDLDLDLRLKNYEIDPTGDSLRNRNNIYESMASDIDFRPKNYELIENSVETRTAKSYDNLDGDFRGADRNFEPLILNSSEIQGLDMSARSFHNYPNINRFHHLYPDVERVDLRLNYSPPPPAYTHADILRVVSLDLTPPGRHSVDLSLRSHPLHQIANSRLLTEHGLHQSRLLSGESRLLSETGRILSDHTTTRILANDQLSANHLLTTAEQSRLLSDESRILTEQGRLIGDARILPPPPTTPNNSVSPVPTFSGYSVSQSPYHPTPLAPRPHVTSPTPTYHHYSTYY